MMGRTHKVGGALTGIVISRFFYTDDLMITGICFASLVCGSILGSLLPDIDKKESTIGRSLWFISWPIYFVRLIIKLLSYILPGRAKKFFKNLDKDLSHRGIAHSLITWAVLTTILWQCSLNLLPGIPLVLQISISKFLLGVSLGMLSHIILDMLTNNGVALFSPVTNVKIKIPLINIRTGGFVESFLRVIMCLLFFVILYNSVVTLKISL